MRVVEDYDAKILFFEMLEAVKQGETVAIVHHGKLVGYLCPAPHPPVAQETEWSVLQPDDTSGDESCEDLPEHLAQVSDSLRDLLDWRRYGRR
jgi:antitoxin (DNA-binding transcriptional repressor) of toxin-antitoxin stability system